MQVLQDDVTLPPPGTVSELCRDFLALCLQRDPSRRPAATALLTHPWVAQAAATDLKGLMKRTMFCPEDRCGVCVNASDAWGGRACCCTAARKVAISGVFMWPCRFVCATLRPLVTVSDQCRVPWLYAQHRRLDEIAYHFSFTYYSMLGGGQGPNGLAQLSALYVDHSVSPCSAALGGMAPCTQVATQPSTAAAVRLGLAGIGLQVVLAV